MANTTFGCLTVTKIFLSVLIFPKIQLFVSLKKLSKSMHPWPDVRCKKSDAWLLGRLHDCLPSFLPSSPAFRCGTLTLSSLLNCSKIDRSALASPRPSLVSHEFKLSDALSYSLQFLSELSHQMGIENREKVV